MKFFVGGLGNWYNDYSLVERLVLKADQLGFDGALIPDHYMWGTMGGMMMRPDRYVTMESWITLSYLAGKTEQIQLGTLVTPIPFRPPGIMAKMISTLDVLSKGRVVTGIGAGWSQVEFDGFSEWNGPKIRVDKTQEGLELMLELWTKDKVSFKGKYYKAKAAVLEPKPIQKPYPKLLFGGVGDRMLALAGRYGDIVFVPPFRGPHAVEEGRKKVLQSAEKWNRVNKVSFMGGSMMGQAITDTKEHITRIEAAINSSDSYYLVSFERTEQGLESMDNFAKDVIPSFNKN
jgi:alkanesulfonate monooxygenase SsuD/methylene tetrahydromethanopterin reductase-like flavin-dependent oxidoreductase (luciferase family)